MTIQKLKIFEMYNGNGDEYVYAKSKHERILSGSEFAFLERLVQGIKLIQRGLAADSYIEQINLQLKESCDSVATISYLKEIASR